MFHTFSVERFRSIRRCDLRDLKRITLLTGKNNVGKSAMLEAMFIHTGNYNPHLVMITNALRGMNTYTLDSNRNTAAPWKSVFYNFDESQPIKLTGEVSHEGRPSEPVTVTLSAVMHQSEINGLGAQLRGQLLKNAILGPSKILRLEFAKGRKGRDHQKYHLLFDDKQPIVFPTPPNPEYPGRLLSAATKEQPTLTAQQFARFQMEGTVEIITEALKPLEPRLNSLEMVFEGEPILHGDIGLSNRRLVPLPLMGDGLNRVTALMLAIGTCSGGTVFVDDIDTGLHYSIMGQFWTTIFRAASRFDVQIIATTHSAECAEAALEAAVAEKRTSDLSIIRLERSDERVIANHYSAEDLGDAIEAGYEVR